MAKFIEEHINEEKVKEAVRTLNKQKVRTHLQTKGPEKKIKNLAGFEMQSKILYYD